MEKNILVKRFAVLGMFALVLLVMNSCLMEYPEETANGEMGEDPTFVTLDTKVMIDLKNAEGDGIELNSRAEEKVYKHRIVVAAYEGRELRAREIVYEDKPLTNRLQTEVKLKLHARKYSIVVWADYYSEQEDPIYDIDLPDGLLGIKGRDRYLGNSEYKKAYYSSDEIDLTEYKDEWGTEIKVEVRPEPPMARYELVATDVKKFLADSPDVGSIKLTVSYDSYVPTGFNALDGITKHAFLNQSYNTTIKRPEDGKAELPLLFDYVFVDPQSSRSGNRAVMPITLKVEDVTDSGKPVELASSTFNLVLDDTDSKKITFDFLTTKDGQGVGIDHGFDGSDEVDVTVD